MLLGCNKYHVTITAAIFPYTLQIIPVSILPSMCRCDNNLEEYNAEMQCMFMGATRYYPMTDRCLWVSREFIHISSDFGIPIFIAVLSQDLRGFLEKIVHREA